MVAPLPVHFTAQAWAFMESLPQENRCRVKQALDLLAAGLILPEKVEFMEIPTYKIRVQLPGWPHGLRVFVRKAKSDQGRYILVIDIGDHVTCATAPGQSVYADERK